MTYARQEWQEERASWRAVIQLNLVRNVNTVLDFLAEEMSPKSDTASSAPSSSSAHQKRASVSVTPFNEKHRLLKLRLGPLRRIQKDLERRLGAATMEIQSTTVTTAAPFSSSYQKPVLQEFSINSSNGWKTALDRFRSHRPSPAVPKRGWDAELEEITEVIASCAEDMKAIWEDPTIRSLLDKRQVRLDETPGL
jgi:guanine nucleotide-binding protein alpha-1 subunit